MKRVRERQLKTPYVKLVRDTSGRLRPEATARDIGDIWAQQRRGQLADAIAQDKRKTEYRRLRKERGLVGAGSFWLSGPVARAKAVFFGEHRKAPAKTAVHERIASEIIEINLNVPKVRLPRFITVRTRPMLRFIGRNHWRVILLVVAVVLVTGLGWGVFHVIAGRTYAPQKDTSGSAQTAGPVRGTPPFATLLPAGHTADSLGGWYRVSPPDRDPVYAYVDHIGNIQLDVSEQPLPPSFQTNTSEQIAQLAAGFSATEKLAAGDVTAYIGTSAKGPQSLILTKKGVLILIKSASIVTTDQWIAYIASLQ